MVAVAPIAALVRRIASDDLAVSDADLIDRFTRDGDQAAFELLVWRHGTMVWATCRRILGRDRASAEDACQAAFIALARHARHVRNRGMVAGWLHRVAVRVSLDLLAARRRSGRPIQSDEEYIDPGQDPARDVAGRELRGRLDAAINRLSDPLRVPFVLCELEGRSNAEAAAVIGCPVGTVESRLTEARRRLRRWLTARGVKPFVGLSATSILPDSVRAAVVRATMAGNSISPSIRRLADRVGRASPIPTLRIVTGLVTAMIALTVIGNGDREAGGMKVSGPPVTPMTVPPLAERSDTEGFPLPDAAVTRLGSARLRHGSWVNDLRFSSDGKKIASVGLDNTIRVWDGSTGKELVTLRRPEGGFDRVSFASGDTVVVVVGHNKGNECDLWRIDAVTGTVRDRNPLPANSPLPATVRFNSDGSRGSIGSAGTKTLTVFDTTTGAVVWSVTLADAAPTGVAFSVDGSEVAVADGSAVRFYTAAGKERQDEVLRGASPTAVALSPDGSVVVAVDKAKDGLVAWNRKTGAQRWRNQTRAEYSLGFSPDGTILAPTGYGFTAHTLDPVDGLAGGTGGKKGAHFDGMVEATCSAFRPDGKVIAYGTISGTICLFDPVSGTPVAPSADPPHEVRWMRFSPDGKTLFGWSADWFAWDVATGTQRRITRTGWNYGEPLSPDGKFTARVVWYSGYRPAGSPDDGTRLEIRDSETGRVVYTHSGKPFQGTSWKDFTPDGKALVAGLHDGTVRVWAIDTGKELVQLPVVGSASQSHAFSADGRVLVTGSNGKEELFPVRVYDLTSGTVLAKWNPGVGVLDVAVSADGRRVTASVYTNSGGVAGPRDVALVWDVATGKEVGRFPLQVGSGELVALSPDGRTVAVAPRWKGDVRVYEVASRRIRFAFPTVGENTGLVFAPDGRTLAAASKQAPVYLWDLAGVRAAPVPNWNADQVWSDLGAADAAVGFAAVRRLRAEPEKAALLLKDKLALPAPPEAAVLKRLFADLDAAAFQTREAASTALASHGESIRPNLDSELAKTTSAEVRARLQKLLDGLTGPTSDNLRRIRAVEALEGLDTPSVKSLLDAWAKGSFGILLQSEAVVAGVRKRK